MLGKRMEVTIYIGTKNGRSRWRHDVVSSAQKPTPTPNTVPPVFLYSLGESRRHAVSRLLNSILYMFPSCDAILTNTIKFFASKTTRNDVSFIFLEQNKNRPFRNCNLSLLFSESTTWRLQCDFKLLWSAFLK